MDSLSNKSAILTSSKGFRETSENENFASSVSSTLVCFQCGGYLDRKDKFCPNCGDDTKEERNLT